MVIFTSWIQEAIVQYCTMLQELRLTSLQDKKKNKRSAVYVERLVNDLLLVFTKTVVGKLTAFREKCLEKDSASWERSLVLVKPGTCMEGMLRFAQSHGLAHSVASMKRAQEPVIPLDVSISANTNSGTASLSGSIGGESQGSLKAESQQCDSSLGNRPSATLPSIAKPKLTAAQSRNQKKKEEAFVPKVLTQDEILVQCFHTVAAQLSRNITHRVRTPFDLCAVRIISSHYFYFISFFLFFFVCFFFKFCLDVVFL